jgi:organic hydroperoxide reductase OsmC/OhrA
VDVRCTFDVADKLGLEGPGATFESVVFSVDVRSPAPPERVKALVLHAERGCHAGKSLRDPVAVTTTVMLNGEKVVG